MRALLVDDERLARARLRRLLAAHPEVRVVAEADSAAAAEAAVRAHDPDLIFLDVSMPGGSGFDLLARARVDASIVFVTAYDEHAVRAFEVGAVDYLLKPVEAARLADTLARLPARPRRLCLAVDGALRVVPLSALLFVRASGDYTTLHLADGSTVTRKETLSHWEARLGPSFLRVHRDALVSLSAVERLERVASAYRCLVRGTPIPVSRSRARALRKCVGGA